MLGFLSRLMAEEREAVEAGDMQQGAALADEQDAFLTEHVLPWLAPWRYAVEKHARTDYYRGVGAFVFGSGCLLCRALRHSLRRRGQRVQAEEVASVPLRGGAYAGDVRGAVPVSGRMRAPARCSWRLCGRCCSIARKRAPSSRAAPSGIWRGSFTSSSFGLLALSAFCLLLDLGSPHRFFLLFLRPTASLLSAGSFVLLAALLRLRPAWQRFHALGWPAPSWARKGLEALCAVLATVLMVYTGLYLAWMEAVPLWSNGALPALFALSSLSSGMAALCFSRAPFVRDWALLSGWIGGLHRAHLVVLGTRVSGACRLSRPGRDEPVRRPEPRAACLACGGQGPWFYRGLRAGRHRRSFWSRDSCAPLRVELRRWPQLRFCASSEG